jgi:hypothetical protein
VPDIREESKCLAPHEQETWKIHSLRLSDYGLDDQAIEDRSPAGAKDFSSSLCVQTGSGAHPATCTMGTGGTFPGAKRSRSMKLTTHPHLVPRSRATLPLPPSATMACSGTALLLFFIREVG